MVTRRFLVTLALVACRTESPHTTPATTPSAPPAASSGTSNDVSVLDEVAYYDALHAARPDLLASDCYDTLTIKPKYRGAILREHDSVPAIRARAYSADLRARDDAWVAAFREGELAFCAEHPGSRGCARVCKAACDACPSAPVARPPFVAMPFEPSGYSLCNFVGYRVGDGHLPAGAIRDWKVFFELGDDFTEVLTPKTYLEFTEALSRAGFHGDSKVTMSAGRERFQYNDIIVHAATPDDARIAERVGLAKFAGKIVSRARGLDIADENAEGGVLDWHHHLCAHGKTGIPDEGLAYVRGQ